MSLTPLSLVRYPVLASSNQSVTVAQINQKLAKGISSYVVANKSVQKKQPTHTKKEVPKCISIKIIIQEYNTNNLS